MIETEYSDLIGRAVSIMARGHYVLPERQDGRSHESLSVSCKAVYAPEGGSSREREMSER